MSAAGQHQRADEYKDHLKHASILSLLQGAKQSITRPSSAEGRGSEGPVLIVANDRHWIKASVEPSGRFTVVNGRNGFSKTYMAR
jgi:hypothetical protein